MSIKETLPSDLVTVRKTTSGAYGYVNRRTMHTRVIITEEPAFSDDPFADAYDILSRTPTIDLPIPIDLEIPHSHEFDPDLCSCSSIREALGLCLEVTVDSAYVIPKLELNEESMVKHRLEKNAEEARRVWPRIALRYCPFDGRDMDPRLSTIPYPATDPRPFCCEWMKMMTSIERIRLSAPGERAQTARFVIPDSPDLRFFHCPRCGTETSALFKRRQRLYLRSQALH